MNDSIAFARVDSTDPALGPPPPTAQKWSILKPWLLSRYEFNLAWPKASLNDPVEWLWARGSSCLEGKAGNGSEKGREIRMGGLFSQDLVTGSPITIYPIRPCRNLRLSLRLCYR